MRSITITAVLFFTLALLNACGPSTADQAQAQQHQLQRDDSIKKAVDDKYAAEQQLKATHDEVTSLHKILENENATLEAEKDRMNKIKEWQLGRSRDEREQQIKSQSLKIQRIEDSVTATQQEMDAAENKATKIIGEMRK